MYIFVGGCLALIANRERKEDVNKMRHLDNLPKLEVDFLFQLSRWRNVT